MENLTGIPADKVLGKHPLELFPFLKDNGVMESLEKALKGEVVDSVDFYYHISESEKSGWSTDSSATLHNAKGEIIGVIGIIRSITKRKQAEIALHESNDRNLAMLLAIPDLMFRLDRQGVYLDFKADVSDLYAKSLPSIIGKRNRDITS